MTVCEEDGEIMPVRFVDRKFRDVAIDSPRLAFLVFGPNAKGQSRTIEARRITAH